MQGQRQKLRGRRQRRSKPRSESRAHLDPILIAARRPNSPLIATSSGHRLVAASARPAARPAPQTVALAEPESQRKRQRPPAERRSARIVQLNGADADDAEKQRLRLLDRFLLSEGRGAISRAANEYWQAGFRFPEEQEVQLKLLEHFDESHARTALDALSRLLERESPLQRPVLEMRLRRLEEYAEDPQIREVAGVLRRAIR
jgi:hypothetical protein